jgi:predicted alpha/beta-hydrolase family hydrolase
LEVPARDVKKMRLSEADGGMLSEAGTWEADVATKTGMQATAGYAPGVEIPTVAGPARVELDEVPAPAFLLVLTHGAGGGIDSPDLLAARRAGLECGGAVARVIQPYRVRGARAPGSAERQDAAWVETVRALGESFPGIPLIQGGRSNGARVACRTARAAGARGVIALAFPLHPPGPPERSRLDELRSAGTHVLVVTGDRDPFGVPEGDSRTRVVVLAGESHALAREPRRVGKAVGQWLADLGSEPAGLSVGRG